MSISWQYQDIVWVQPSRLYNYRSRHGQGPAYKIVQSWFKTWSGNSLADCTIIVQDMVREQPIRLYNQGLRHKLLVIHFCQTTLSLWLPLLFHACFDLQCQVKKRHLMRILSSSRHEPIWHIVGLRQKLLVIHFCQPTLSWWLPLLFNFYFDFQLLVKKRRLMGISSFASSSSSFSNSCC